MVVEELITTPNLIVPSAASPDMDFKFAENCGFTVMNTRIRENMAVRVSGSRNQNVAWKSSTVIEDSVSYCKIVDEHCKFELRFGVVELVEQCSFPLGPLWLN